MNGSFNEQATLILLDWDFQSSFEGLTYKISTELLR